MDAVIAVVGTLLGTLAGAITAGWWQRESARTTIRAEHIKAMRQPRHDAYKSFIQSAVVLRERVLVNDGYEDTTREEENLLSGDITSQWADLVLLGPKSVNLLGSILHDASLDAIRQMGICRHLTCAPCDHESDDAEERAHQEYEVSLRELENSADELAVAINAFAAVASGHLEDDGTDRRRRAPFWKRRKHLPPAMLVRD
ncbi:hypothetical protein [Streptomyces sp900116325]|uniref:hypothetical protein n=1 Tax=Streptomyces sp. 900116325 TaxID=3154295 RepID=UPI0033AFBD08